MKKPRRLKPNQEPTTGYVLDVLCWLYVKNYPSFGTQAEVADMLKDHVRSGRMIIDLHPDGQRVRLIPSALNAPRGALQ